MCPPFSQMGSMVFFVFLFFKSCKLLKYPKARIQKRAVGEKGIRVSSCASNNLSKRRYQPWLYGIWEVSEEAGWAEHATLLWSGAPVAIQTQINRGGTLELMIEKEGGKACRRAGWALQSRSPEKWRTGAHYAHFQPQLRTGLPRCCCLSSKLLRLFPQLFTTCHIFAKVRDTRVGCMATWEFHGLGTWKTFSDALLELVASIVTVDYWHTAGPLAAIYWGKILFGSVYVRILQGGKKPNSTRFL